MRSLRGSRVLVAAATSVTALLAVAQGPTYAAPAAVQSAAAATKADLAAQVAALDSDGDHVPDRPDATSAMMAAQQLGHPVEDLSQRTPTTQVFADPEGTWTTRVAAGPVRAQDPASGEWHAIDTTLAKSNGAWHPKVGLGAISFSDGGTGPLATMTNVDGKDLSWTWPTALPKPTADGSTLTYADVVPNGDLVVTAKPSGFSESVVLKSAPTDALSLPLLIDTDGATLSKHADGSLSLRGKKGKLITAPTPMMWDSKDSAADTNGSKPITTTLTRNGDRTELVLKPDAAFLADPDTTYPVTIDPSFSVTASAFSVLADPQLERDGADPVELETGYGSPYTYYSFLKFDPTLLRVDGITAATLSLYGTSSDTCDPSTVTVQRLVSDWNDPMRDWSQNPTTTSVGESTATNPAHGGPGSCSAMGWDTWDITSIAQAWAGSTANYGVELFDESPTDVHNLYAAFDGANPPAITITSNGRPGTPDVPTVTDSSPAGTYVATSTPSFSTRAVDPDQGLVHYTFEVHETASDTSPVVSSCTTSDVSSGTTSSCVPTTPLSNGTHYVRASASDGSLTSDWSPWQMTIVNYVQPDPASVSCSNTIANGVWFTVRPAATTTCTFTSWGATRLAWTLNGKNQSALVANSAGVATTTIAIPTQGWTDVEVHGVSNAGIAGSEKSFTFGVGSAWIITPTTGTGSAGSFTIDAATVGAPATSTVSAVLQYRKSGSTTDPNAGWTPATAVTTTDGGAFDGSGLVTTTSMTSTPDLVWTPGAELDVSAPALLDARVEFAVVSADDVTTKYDSQTVTLQLNTHDANASGPTAQVGPGSVDLISGEFSTSAIDVSIGGLGVSRSQLSNAPNASGADGVLGDGWNAHLATGGPASYTVTDQRSASASFLFRTPDGISYAYQSASSASAGLAGDFAPIGDAIALGATLKLDASTGVLTYTEQDGTQTTFEQYASSWVPTATIGTTDESTTSYYYDPITHFPTWVVAPAPTGVTCTPTDLNPGCAVLHLNYTLFGFGRVVTSIDYTAWDPKVDSDGLPTSDAAMSTVSVADYAYNGDGTLQAEWDPRLGDGAAALKTTYGYATPYGLTTRVTTITPPGQQPWSIHYGPDGAVTSVTRPQDPAVGTGNATWTIRYGVPLNSSTTGLPNMSQTATKAWGETAADAPVAAAAVFGPDKVPAATPTTDDWTYAQLYYWTEQSRLANRASYGNNAWQIESSRYDDRGNDIWDLSAAGRAQAIADGGGDAAKSAGASDRYANWTKYNSAGDRVEAEYGPMITAVADDGVQATLRSLTKYVYDDEADGSLIPDRPTGNALPDGGFDLVVQTLSWASDEATPGSWAISGTTPDSAAIHLYDKKETRYYYDPARTRELNGWTMRQATQTLVWNGAGWDTTQESYDSSGRVLVERTPEGVADNDPQQWHKTVYYTADNSADREECDNHPQWAGLVCWEGPAAQPASGQQIPQTSYTGYSIDQASTRIVTASGTVAKAEVDTYDAAGRAVSTTTTSTLGADQANPTTTTTYSPTTGLATTVSNGSMTMTTGYDTWGRVTSQTDGAGNATTTTYNAAAQVATVNDGKGTYTYGYGAITPPGSLVAVKERRGMPTTLNTGVSGSLTTITGSYDSDGNLATENFPTTSSYRLTQSQAYDLAGNLTNRSTTTSPVIGIPLAQIVSSQKVSVARQVRIVNDPNRQVTYSYDQRGRLVQTLDSYTGTTANCQKRTYALSPDSDRDTFTTASYATASCTGTATSTSTVSSTYDSAHRIINTGYTYDDLGRTTTLPATATNNPASGAVSETYYADDTVHTLTQGNTSQTYTLDPLGRISTTATYTSGVDLKETTNHYTGNSDSPAWTETRTRPNSVTTWTTTWTRYVLGLDGTVAMTQTGTATPQVTVFNTHGDATSTINLGVISFGAFSYYTEFGTTRDGGASTNRYGWLATAQRDSQGLGGITLMGTRLYSPMTGRFLSRDPIYGGNDNAYIYPADPVNNSDLNGQSKAPTKGTLYQLNRDWCGNAGCLTQQRTCDTATQRCSYQWGWTFMASVVRHSYVNFKLTFTVDNIFKGGYSKNQRGTYWFHGSWFEGRTGFVYRGGYFFLRPWSATTITISGNFFGPARGIFWGSDTWGSA